MPVTSTSSSILVDVEGSVCKVVMNRPKSLNALNLELMDTMASVMRDISNDDSIRCVVLSGAGDHFMAGGDIKHFGTRLGEVSDRTAFRHEIEAMINGFHETVFYMRAMPKPIIASVRGAVAGAGVSIMLACDMVVATESSFYTLAYCNLGTSPDGGSTFSLPRATGMKRAMEIALLGDRFDAATAERWGLVNRVVSDCELDSEAEALAARLAAGPTYAYARTKALMNESLSNTLHQQLNAESAAFADCAVTDDFNEGVTAFNAKRRPKFTGK
ncbi:MAG: enoyl-CoA hydratase [Magnetovibrio sp.]|nr:enoyl-CoA hydratase [Magnetovibrio sp.]